MGNTNDANLLPTRRGFLAQAGSLAAAAGRPPAASEHVALGFIGMGNRGRLLMGKVQSATQAPVVAVCDIYGKRLDLGRSMAKLPAKDAHHEYDDLLARSDVDAVVIATPDHHHAPMTLAALAAGKDVYLEKPATYTVDEARQVAEKVAKTGRVLQVGSQHTSDARFQTANRLIEEGWIGPVVWAQSSYSRNSLAGEWQYPIDDGAESRIDWQAFLGSAPKRPYDADRFFRWRKYWDYSGGIATDLFYHRLSALEVALGPSFPTQVSGHGGIYIHRNREVPDSYATAISYDDHYVAIAGSTASRAGTEYMGPTIYGHKGSIRFEPEAVIVEPEREYAKEFRERAAGSDILRIAVKAEDLVAKHLVNFLECVQTRKQPNFDAEFGYKVMAAIGLGVESYRKGRMMHFRPGA